MRARNATLPPSVEAHLRVAVLQGSLALVFWVWAVCNIVLSGIPDLGALTLMCALASAGLSVYAVTISFDAAAKTLQCSAVLQPCVCGLVALNYLLGAALLSS